MAHVGDMLAEMLMRYGVTHVFGQPGGQTAALYDGIARRAPRLRHILIRDERPRYWAPYREKGVASQGFDQISFLSSITKSSFEVPSSAALPQLIRSSF